MTVHPRCSSNSDRPFDIIVIGGGVYGLMVATEAARTGMRVAIVEKDRVGCATSSNWFRILHGGLRYLQTLDVPRLRESIVERRRFLATYPGIVRPLGFLMPLYGRKARHPMAFRTAFALDAALTLDRNRGLQKASRIGRGRVLSASQVLGIAPEIRTSGLLGGALWNDAVAEDGAALLGALRSEAENLGCVVVEGANAMGLHTDRGAVRALLVKHSGAREEELETRAVVNAAGPWSADLAEALDGPRPELFWPSLAFNLVLDIPPPASVGLAISPPDQPDLTLFLYPLKRGTFAGTWHTVWNAGPEAIVPAAHEIDAFLDALNRAHPTLNARREHVLKVHAGLLPARAPGTADLAVREIILDHGAEGGPIGLFSVSGVKFTTARRVAEKVIARIVASGRVPASKDEAGTRP